MKTIIKRSGITVRYEPQKMKKFLLWACNGYPHEELQKKIEIILNDNELSVDQMLKYLYKFAEQMATRISIKPLEVSGRIYMVRHIKRHRAGGIDFININKNKLCQEMYLHHHNLTISDENWNNLSKMIDLIDLDFDYSLPISDARLIVEKFGRVHTNNLSEIPSMVFLRQAIDISQYQTGQYDWAMAEACFKLLKGKAFTNASPEQFHAGKSNRSTGSCTLIAGGDSTKHIMNVAGELALHSKHGSGNSIDVSEVRASGTPISGVEGHAKGPVGFIRIYQDVLQGFDQGGKRKGAGVAYMRWWHKNIKSFLFLKNNKGVSESRIRDLKYAMVSNDILYDKVRNNEEICLVCPKLASDYLEGNYLIDTFGEEFEKHYNIIFDAIKNKDLEGTIVEARTLFFWFAQNLFDHGNEYEFFMENVNDYNMLKDTVKASNLCMAGDTLILTEEGNKPIRELSGRTVKCWNGTSFSSTPIYQTSDSQRVYTVNLSNNVTVEATPYHRWLVKDGYHRTVIKQTKELKSGDKLVKNNVSKPVKHGTDVLSHAYSNGFYSGDGTSLPNPKIYLYGGKKSLLDHLTGYRKTTESGGDRINVIYKNDVLKDKFFVPDNTYCIGSRLDWLSGYLDADGTLTDNNGTESIQAASVEFNFVVKIRSLLLELGINSKVADCAEEGRKLMPLNDGSGKSGYFYCKKTYRLLIAGSQLSQMLSLGYKGYRVMPSERSYQREAMQYPKVISIIDEGKDVATYCGSEPILNQLCFNGQLTMNCMEVLISTKRTKFKTETGLCFLNSTNIYEYMMMTEKQKYQLIYYQVKALDNQIETDFHPVPYATKTYSNESRFIGLGISNLATHFASKRIKYSSHDALLEMAKIMNDWSYNVIKSSIQLAKERGPAINISRSYWQDHLPIMKGNDLAKKLIPEFDFEYEKWDELLLQSKAHGVRNLLMMAIAPTASSAASVGLTEGIEPATEKLFVRSGTLPVSAAINSDQSMLNHYCNAFDVPNKSLIEVNAVRQLWVDQSQSFSTWFKGDSYDVGDIFNERDYARSLGTKTMYYVNLLKKESEDVCESCS